MALLASEVITMAVETYLNDPSKIVFNDTVMLPFIKEAVLDLESAMLEAGIPYMETNSSTLALTAITSVAISSSSSPALPSDLLIPILLEERKTGSGAQFVPMIERERLPERAQYETLQDWCWEDDQIKLVGATAATDVKIEYQKSLGAISATTSSIYVLGSKKYLALRASSIAALTVGNNPERSFQLKAEASTELSRFIVSRIKETQNYPARRLPYGYVRRQLRLLRQGR
jgi:hypothetical protein